MDYERWPFEDGHITKTEIPSAQRFKKGPIVVIISSDPFDFFGDGKSKVCLHLSISHHSRYPTWQEIKDARYRFMPKDRDVFQVLPPLNDYCSLHKNCFHLWMPLLDRV